jgi:hypothetical protein
MQLSDALGKDFYVIDDDQYTDRDLKTMALPELESLKLRINQKISSLSAAIKTRQMEYSSGGEATPKEWYISRKHALNVNQCIMPFINSLIKQRKKESRGLCDYFMDEAKAYLKPIEYEAILQNARREMDTIRGR